jgi:hypothetical protein
MNISHDHHLLLVLNRLQSEDRARLSENLARLPTYYVNDSLQIINTDLTSEAAFVTLADGIRALERLNLIPLGSPLIMAKDCLPSRPSVTFQPPETVFEIRCGDSSR